MIPRDQDDVAKVIASGKTPAVMHRPIMVREVLEALAPKPGDVAVDCTLGYGGHTEELLRAVLPGGRLIALDADPIELPKTEARLRAKGFGPEVFVAHRTNFAGLPQVLAAEGVAGADVLLADLGLSSMQIDNPDRGFSYKEPGPLDMRMNPSRGEPAFKLLERLDERSLAEILTENDDEPHADRRIRAVVSIAVRRDGVERDRLTGPQGALLEAERHGQRPAQQVAVLRPGMAHQPARARRGPARHQPGFGFARTPWPAPFAKCRVPPRPLIGFGERHAGAACA